MIISIKFSNLKQHIDYINREITCIIRIEEIIMQIIKQDSGLSNILYNQLECIENEKQILFKRRELLERIYEEFKNAGYELDERLLRMKNEFNKG